VPTRPVAVTVLDESGAEVGVTGRYELTGRPCRVVLHGGPREVRAWAGPWPADERWWEPEETRVRSRVQVVIADGQEQSALLLVYENERWVVEGVYD
jgi:protein ImuB